MSKKTSTPTELAKKRLKLQTAIANGTAVYIDAALEGDFFGGMIPFTGSIEDVLAFSDAQVENAVIAYDGSAKWAPASVVGGMFVSSYADKENPGQFVRADSLSSGNRYATPIEALNHANKAGHDLLVQITHVFDYNPETRVVGSKETITDLRNLTGQPVELTKEGEVKVVKASKKAK